MYPHGIYALCPYDTITLPSAPTSTIYLYRPNGQREVSNNAHNIRVRGGHRKACMKSESLHYNEKLVNLVLEAILDPASRESEPLADFGVLLTSDNVHPELQRIRTERAVYRSRYSEDVDEVRATVSRVVAKRKPL